MTREEKEAIRALIDALPKCWDCADEIWRTEKCGYEAAQKKNKTIATHIRLDSAGDAVTVCAKHARPGGLDGDEGPFEKKYAAPLRLVQAILAEDAV